MTVRDLLMSAGGAGSPPVYVEDVFSTYLYTGTGATQSINNGIDLATKGGMTWIKSRSAATNNNLFDTTQGATKLIHSNTTAAAVTDTVSLTTFNSTGFTLGTGNTTGNQVNTSAATYASWSFRKQPKFFDVVQYTGTGVAYAINHSLGSVPGCIMIKETSATNSWAVYHKGANGGTTPEQYYSVLNTTAAQVASSAWWNNTAPTTTQFTVGTNATVNASGQTYIAYIFADQAGGFGATGTDSAIACGSWAASASDTITLGWEPQWILVKDTTSAYDNWYVIDNMRGFSLTVIQYLDPNLTNAETTGGGSKLYPTATGFAHNSLFPAGDNIIYIAIRRPMKVPTDATTVFTPVTRTGTSANASITSLSYPPDLAFTDDRNGGAFSWFDRLRGGGYMLQSESISAEVSKPTEISSFNQTGISFGVSTNGWTNYSGEPYINYLMRRASGFFDEVCYTGTGANTTQNHNLTVAPEMMIVKERSATNDWWVYHSATGNTKYSVLNTTAIPVTSSTAWNNTTPTASVFSIGTGTPVNTSGATYVAYLFATCAGVSKVGTYTGNATGQSIACGFGSGGARFILIKRTDSTGDWYCFDSANGLTSSSSPYLTLDTTNAQTTGNNGVYASSGGFTLGATASLTTNIATATYIFLAIS